MFSFLFIYQNIQNINIQCEYPGFHLAFCVDEQWARLVNIIQFDSQKNKNEHVYDPQRKMMIYLWDSVVEWNFVRQFYSSMQMYVTCDCRGIQFNNGPNIFSSVALFFSLGLLSTVKGVMIRAKMIVHMWLCVLFGFLIVFTVMKISRCHVRVVIFSDNRNSHCFSNTISKVIWDLPLRNFYFQKFLFITISLVYIWAFIVRKSFQFCIPKLSKFLCIFFSLQINLKWLLNRIRNAW